MKKILLVILIIIVADFTSAQTANWTWAKSGKGTGGDVGYSVSTDAAGNVFVTGSFNSPSLTLGTFTLINSGGYDLFIAKYDPSGTVLWAKSGTGTTGDYGQGVCTDAAGNVFVTGYFASPSLTLGTFTLANSGTDDVFIAKYDPSGTVLWAKSGTGTTGDYGQGICTDATGNVFITGYFSSPALTLGTFTLTNTGSGDVYVAKYNSSGTVLWARSGTGSSFDTGFGVSADATGNVLITGDYGNTLTVGTFTLGSTGSYNTFVIKYDPSGTVLWAKSGIGIGGNDGTGISTDAAGNSFITGSFACPTLTLGTFTLTNTSANGYFVAKYDPSGTVLWAKSGIGTGNNYGFAISTDGVGNAYLTGYFDSPTFSLGTFTLNNSGSGDVFVAKYNSSGTVLWAKSGIGTAGDYGQGICADATGNIFVTGPFASPFLALGTFTLNSSGGNDAFVAKICQTPSQPPIINGSATICFGTSFTYSVAPVFGALSYTWSLPAGWLGSSSTVSISATASGASGNVTVTAGNACGTSLQQTLNVTVNSLPTISANTNNTLICGPPYQQTSTLTANGASTYTWNPGGNGTSISVSPSVTTVYTVTGTDVNGCMNTTSFTQSVSTCASVGQFLVSDLKFEVFPNPTNEKIVVISGVEKQTLEVYNALSEKVMSKEIISEKTEIDISSQTAGIYFIKIGNLTKKIIKQ